MKNKIIIVVLFSLLIPNTALASWWNPFTWFEKEKTAEISIEISNSTPVIDSKIETNSAWWNPFLWSEKSEVSEKMALELETVKVKVAVEKSKLGTDGNVGNKSLTSIKFDDAVIKSVLMIKIFDNEQYISQGSGISIGGLGNILTNYHVAKDVFLNPSRYKAYGCITNLLNTDPECIYLLSPTRKSLNGDNITAQYDEKLDLALLYVDQVKVDGKWVSIIDTPFDNLKDRSINISSYTKNYQDLKIGSLVFSIGYPDYGGEKTIQVDGSVKKIINDQQSGQPIILSALNISHGNSGGPVFNSKGELVGVTVACLTTSSGAYECENNSGIFIPLPTVNWWYTKVNNSHVIAWQGKNYYSYNNGISDDTQKGALCILEGNAHYDSNISIDSCVCNAAYFKNTDGKCVDNSGVATPSEMHYGKPADPEAEKKALQMLDSLFNDLSQNSAQTQTTPVIDQVELYIHNNFNPAMAKVVEGLEYTNKGIYYASTGLRVDAEKYFNYSIESFNNTASILGETPPVGWVETHNCFVSFLINSVTASVYLKSALYYSGTSKAMEYIETAQTFSHKASEDQACVLKMKVK